MSRLDIGGFEGSTRSKPESELPLDEYTVQHRDLMDAMAAAVEGRDLKSAVSIEAELTALGEANPQTDADFRKLAAEAD